MCWFFSMRGCAELAIELETDVATLQKSRSHVARSTIPTRETQGTAEGLLALLPRAKAMLPAMSSSTHASTRAGSVNTTAAATRLPMQAACVDSRGTMSTLLARHDRPRQCIASATGALAALQTDLRPDEVVSAGAEEAPNVGPKHATDRIRRGEPA